MILGFSKKRVNKVASTCEEKRPTMMLESASVRFSSKMSHRLTKGTSDNRSYVLSVRGSDFDVVSYVLKDVAMSKLEKSSVLNRNGEGSMEGRRFDRQAYTHISHQFE